MTGEGGDLASDSQEFCMSEFFGSARGKEGWGGINYRPVSGVQKDGVRQGGMSHIDMGNLGMQTAGGTIQPPKASGTSSVVGNILKGVLWQCHKSYKT